MELAAMDGVEGLDLLAYRHDGDVERLVGPWSRRWRYPL